MKRLEVRQKYSAARRIFNSLLGVSSGDETCISCLIYYMKHLEVRQKYSAARRIFNSLLGVSSGDETLHLMFDILHETP